MYIVLSKINQQTNCIQIHIIVLSLKLNTLLYLYLRKMKIIIPRKFI